MAYLVYVIIEVVLIGALIQPNLVYSDFIKEPLNAPVTRRSPPSTGDLYSDEVSTPEVTTKTTISNKINDQGKTTMNIKKDDKTVSPSTTTLTPSKLNGSTSTVRTSTEIPLNVSSHTDKLIGSITTATTTSNTNFVGPNTTPIPSPTQAGGGQSSTMASTLGIPTKVSTGNKPMIPTTIPSVSTGNKPMISTTIPSVSTGSIPMISTTIPSVSTNNKPITSTTIPSVIISSTTKGTGIVKVTTVPSIIASITEVGKESTTVAYQSSTTSHVWTSVVELDDEKGTLGWSRKDRICDEKEIISSKDKVIPVKFGPYQSPITYIYVLSDDMDFKGSKLVGGGLREKEATIEFRSDGDSQRIYLAMVCWNKK